MPEQNQPIQGNFGAVFNTATPYLDRITQQLQNQFAARQAYQQKESENTDQLVNKELANVRSADAPEVIDAYTKWKNLKQNLLFNKSLQQNPKAYNQAQMDANMAYADVVGKINKSSQLNQFGKQLYTERNTPGKSNLYADDFGDKASTFWKTPMGQLQNVKLGSDIVDLTNPDSYRYKGMNNVNFGDLEKKAAGTPAQRYQKEEKISDLQSNITPYSFGNSPTQFQQALRGEYSSTPQTYRAASAQWEAIPQQEKDRVDQLFAQIPSEKWQQMGVEGPQSISPTNPQDPADQLAAYKAKVYAINNNPTAGKVYTNVNQQAKMNLQAKNSLNRQEIMEAIKQGNREKLVGIKHAYKEADVKEQSSILNDTYDQIVGDADKSKPHYYLSPDRKTTIKLNPIKISASLQASFAPRDDKGHPIYPSYVGITDDGKYIYPIYHTQGAEESDNKKEVEASLSRPITSAEFKALLGKTYFGVREAAKENSAPSGAPKKVIQGF